MRYIQDGALKAAIFSIVLFVNPLYLLVLLCYLYVFVSFAVFSKFALLTLANLEKAWFCLGRIEIAQCRLIGFT